MKLSTTLNDFLRYGISHTEAITLLAETPFRHADFAFSRSFTDEHWEQNVASCAEAARTHGITFVQAHAVDVDPVRKDAADELLTAERTLASCAKLGIPHVVFHALFCSDQPYPEGKEHFFEQNRAFYSMLLPMAEHYGVTVLAENSVERHSRGNYYFMTGEDLRDFLDFVDHPFLGAVWDTGHANMRKNDQRKDILTLGKRLKAIHVHDNFADRDAHLAPFMGNTNFDAILQGLISIDFDGYFSFEADNSPMLRLTSTAGPTPSLQVLYDNALFATGKQMLSSFGIFEE